MIALIKIPIDKIEAFFDLIIVSIEKSAKVTMTDVGKENTLEALKNKELEGWILSEEEKMAAIVTTRIITDPCFKTKELIVYSFNALKVLSLAIWDEFFKQIIEYTKVTGCTSLLAITVVERIKRVTKRICLNDVTLISVKL